MPFRLSTAFQNYGDVCKKPQGHQGHKGGSANKRLLMRPAFVPWCLCGFSPTNCIYEFLHLAVAKGRMMRRVIGGWAAAVMIAVVNRILFLLRTYCSGRL